MFEFMKRTKKATGGLGGGGGLGGAVSPSPMGSRAKPQKILSFQSPKHLILALLAIIL